MKTMLFAGAAALALFAGAPALAQDAGGASGYVGAGYGRTNLDVDGLGDDDGNQWTVNGAVAFPVSGALKAQIDGEYTRFEADGADADVVSATGHLFHAGESGLIGGFAGLSNAEDTNFWSVGAEAQAYVTPQTTLYGALGFGQVDEFDDADFWAGRGELRFFATDNLRFDVTGGFTRVSADDEDLDITTFGAGAEYQFSGAPVSVFASYERSEIDDFDLTADTVMVGARYNFGGGSLKARDRSGATLGSASRLFGGTLGSAVLATAGEVADELDD